MDIIDHIKKTRDQEFRLQQVEQLEKILRLITSCEGRIQNEIDFCRSVYGEVNGIPKGTDTNQAYINRFRAVKKRLQRYYNYKLTQLTKY